MNISLATNNTMSPLVSSWERSFSASQPVAQDAAMINNDASGDMVSVRPQARLLEDSEVEGVLDSTLSMISNDIFGALGVHSGLDASRVAALLA